MGFQLKVCAMSAPLIVEKLNEKTSSAGNGKARIAYPRSTRWKTSAEVIAAIIEHDIFSTERSIITWPIAHPVTKSISSTLMRRDIADDLCK